MQNRAFKGSLVHKVTKKVLEKLRNIKKTLLRLRTRWLVIGGDLKLSSGCLDFIKKQVNKDFA